jgi:hypothetical protein
VKPRNWCDPPEAFGDREAATRRWNPPRAGADQHEIEDFRSAVIQHAIAISVRRYKNKMGWTQERLADLDGRWPDTGTARWNERLNGRTRLTMRDVSVIMRLLPGAMPSEKQVQTLLAVAEKRQPPPPRWRERDT